jgi:inorganic pyrophosphatase
MSLSNRSLIDLPWRDDRTGEIVVVIETPRGSRNKYVYDPFFGQFRLKKVLPLGFSFPFDFGFIPSTRGGDGDPLDVLVLLDEPLPMGCLVKGRAVGVLELEQTQQGRTFRNDRVIVLPIAPACRNRMQCFADLPDDLLAQMEAFFVGYAAQDGKQVKPVGRGMEERALALIKDAAQATIGGAPGSYI